MCINGGNKMVLETLKDNAALAQSIDWFIKIGTAGFLIVGSLLIAKAVFALEWSVSMGM